jgi:hypothetical protein
MASSSIRASTQKGSAAAYSTPFTLLNEPLTAHPHLDRRQKSKTNCETPYREYCTDETFTLAYCRQSGEPLLQERNYMSGYFQLENEVTLLNMEDCSSPSLKDLNNFELD